MAKKRKSIKELLSEARKNLKTKAQDFSEKRFRQKLRKKLIQKTEKQLVESDEKRERKRREKAERQELQQIESALAKEKVREKIRTKGKKLEAIREEVTTLGKIRKEIRRTGGILLKKRKGRPRRKLFAGGIRRGRGRPRKAFPRESLERTTLKRAIGEPQPGSQADAFFGPRPLRVIAPTGLNGGPEEQGPKEMTPREVAGMFFGLDSKEQTMPKQLQDIKKPFGDVNKAAVIAGFSTVRPSKTILTANKRMNKKTLKKPGLTAKQIFAGMLGKKGGLF